MTSSYDPSTQTAIDMQMARKASSVVISILLYYLWNGQEIFDKRDAIVRILSCDPIFDKSNRSTLGRVEQFRRGLRMISRIIELRDNYGWSEKELEMAFGLCDESLPVNLHSTAFLPPLFSLGSKELVNRLGTLARNHGLLGAYAQTELGHGSNVAALETTATFLPDTQEFEVDSPTLTSTKWWIGSGGLLATHAIVQAQLILPRGKSMGPHLFLVQLRNEDDHQLLPGVSTGDIGAKAFNSHSTNDNGFIRFRSVRVPRLNMLSRFADVTEAGEYVVPPHSKLSYGGMLYIRSGLITASGWQLAKATTIAIRYTTVRRQGGRRRDEKPVIKYPSVYYRLIPLISKSYVYILLGQQIKRSFEQLSQRLASGDTSQLAEMHAVLSAMKSQITASAIESIEVARRSMGGHGFSAAAGVGRIYADQLPSATYEGDNYLLDHQVVRAALKTYAKFKSNHRVAPSPSSNYLRCLNNFTPPQENWKNPTFIITLLEMRAAKLVSTYPGEAADAGAAHRLASGVADAFVAARVGEMIESVKAWVPSGTQDVLVRVLILHLLMVAESALTDIYELNIVNDTASTSVNLSTRLRSEISRSCISLLPERIGLTDAFGFSDWELDSALGVYDGKVYEELWRRAQENPLNKLNVNEMHKEYLKSLFQRGKKKADIEKSKL